MRTTAQRTSLLLTAVITLSFAVGAQAQSHPTVEVSVLYWRPDASLQLSSDGPTLPGSRIDLRHDLGAADHGIPSFSVVLHPGRRHRLTFEYLPIRYDSSTILKRDVAFSGVVYPRGQPVTSSFAFDAVNVGYEYDLIQRSRASFGVVAEAKFADVRQQLTSPTADETRQTSVPAPALGFAFHVAPDPHLTLDVEARGFVVPDGRNGHFGGRYVDVDGGGTIALARHVGARLGVRWIDIRHLGAVDSARMSLPGLYAGVTVTR